MSSSTTDAERRDALVERVLREPTVRELAERAEFGSVDVLPIENDFFRFYRLRR